VFSQPQTMQQVSSSIGPRDITETVLPARFAQTSGEIVPTLTEQATVLQMIFTPSQMLTISGGPFAVTG
jgi:hypothetical protein